MRKLFTTLAVCLIFTSISFSQVQFIPYFPQDQVEKAKTAALTKYADAQLKSVVAIDTSLTIISFNIELLLFMADDADKGKATAWIYVFSSASDPQKIDAIMVGDAVLLGGPTPFNLADYSIPVSMVNQYVTDKSLESVNWIGGAPLVDIILASKQYTDFITANPSGKVRTMTLGYTTQAPLDPNTAYWFIGVQAGSQYTVIVVNAVTGTIVSVDDDFDFNSINTYPNPSVDYLNIEIPEEFRSGVLNTKIVDINGNIISNTTNFAVDESKINTLPFPNGKYIITLSNGQKTMTTPFVINR